MPRMRLSWPYGCKHIAMLAGSWSKWTPQVLMPVKIPQLVEPATGLTGTIEVWTTEIVLPNNVDAIYRYKFVVDGDWVYDAAQPAIKNEHGSYDNYITVSITYV